MLGNPIQQLHAEESELDCGQLAGRAVGCLEGQGDIESRFRVRITAVYTYIYVYIYIYVFVFIWVYTYTYSCIFIWVIEAVSLLPMPPRSPPSRVWLYEVEGSAG